MVPVAPLDGMVLEFAAVMSLVPDSDPSVTPAGSVSVNLWIMPLKAEELLTVTVYVAVPPVGSEVGDTDLVIVYGLVTGGSVWSQGVLVQVDPKLPVYFSLPPLVRSAERWSKPVRAQRRKVQTTMAKFDGPFTPVIQQIACAGHRARRESRGSPRR
jgi:hypothetical protein